MEKKASTLAYQIEEYLKINSRDLQVKPRKISLILQNTQLEPNGFVQLAPRKSELYSSPSPEPSNQEWLSNLALHELRHVAQFDKLTGKLKAPFLEQLALAIYGLTLPSWYFEGDATWTETNYSKGGRGRLPSFEMTLKANEMSGKKYKYEKYLMGSYPDKIPSYYTIGYFMTKNLKENFKENFEPDLYKSLQKNRLIPYNFNRSLKKISGYNGRELFNKTMHDLNNEWTTNEEKITTKSYDIIEPKLSKYYQDWLLPKSYKNKSILALFGTANKTAEIIKIDSNKHISTLIKLGNQIIPNYDIRNDMIVWDELRRDIRYTKRSYNVINLYHLDTKKQEQISSKTRYFYPILHPTKHEILTIEVDLSNQTAIVFIDIATKKVLKKVLIGSNILLQQPAFNADGSKIIAIAISDKGTNLVEVALDSGKLTFLQDWGNQQFERPQYINEDNILFKAHYDGIDNIYNYTPKSKVLNKLTNVPFGAFNPYYNAEQNEILFNNYQSNGYKISKITFDNSTKTASSLLADGDQSSKNRFYTVTDTSRHYSITPYKGLSRTFNFHSLSLSNTNFESLDNFKPGIFWLSNNILNTTQFVLGYEYDTDIKKSTYSAAVNYNKYFPKFTLKYENKGQIGTAKINNKADSTLNFDWREHLVTGQIAIPIAFYKRNYVYSTGFNFSTSYLRRYDISIKDLKNFNSEVLFPLTYQIYWNRNAMLSKMDITPQWGQNFSITYRHLPFENQLNGSIFSIRSGFYLPGFASNHGFQVRFGYQKATGQYQYSNDIPTVSGYGYYKYEKVKNTLLVNYRFPISYPDWAIGGLAYIKRIKGGVFADYQNIHHQSNISPKSFGLQLSVDFNAFRFPLPDFEAAFKATYINDITATQKVVPTFTLNYTY
ncbi:hypothetical protein LZQ00_02195 [Sphingobacterium sp. SRCM116780]|uniref:hypothetical protein n=1 Tax=Sphingobacterium sp. SRCM116780 TaxID=2907623 RepID=UPI001F44B3A6|nr:hypothetical protein [Sphingobacterium sp. SRCM116780]UIR56639.1 hypothetical protein LZQ00_02195 [Sphingobacterium sp. SRCM116780]